MKQKYINVPISEPLIKDLYVGDNVLLSGEIYVARDAAHKRLTECLKKGIDLPFDIKNSVIYYMGPSPTPPNFIIGSAGPTTSHRMDKYTPELLDLGLKCMIGKGNRSQEVINSIKSNKAIYFTAIGGTGALSSKHILTNELIAYHDLGPEAIRKLKIKDFPVIVAIDCRGNNIFEIEHKRFENYIKENKNENGN